MNHQKGFAQVVVLLILLAGIAAGVYLVQHRQVLFSRAYSPKVSAKKAVDLKLYYPNGAMIQNYYLNQASPHQVLWFEKQDQWSFKVYNSAPEDPNSRCHWDLLSWWDDNTLRYSQTHNECPKSIQIDTIYDPPIILLPSLWDENQNWSLDYQAKMIQKESGITVCTGTNNYTASIIGWENISPGTRVLHWRSQQQTTWDNFGKCAGWAPTRWREDYWLEDSLSVEGGRTAKGLKRSKGGNLDVPSDSWDIWFDMWKKLPSLTSTPSPISTITPMPTITPSPLPKPIILPTPTFTRQWGVNWEPLNTGSYTVHFGYDQATINGHTTKIPSDTTLQIKPNATTQLVADLTAGTVNTQYFSANTSSSTGLLRVQTDPPVAANITVSPSNSSSDCCSLELKQQGYECIQQCGSPVARMGDPVPPFVCLSPEQVVSRNRYGCPI